MGVQLTDLTPTVCAEVCRTFLQKYMGLQNGNECFCSSDKPTGTASIPCQTQCSGDSTQSCGGNNVLDVAQISFDIETLGKFETDGNLIGTMGVHIIFPLRERAWRVYLRRRRKISTKGGTVRQHYMPSCPDTWFL